MTSVWQNFLGNEIVIERFTSALKSGRVTGSYLFVGPEGIGKKLFALKFAQCLLCETTDETELEACGKCPACQQVLALSHPDIEIVSKPKDRAFIPLELLIGDKENRMRDGLCHRISLKPFSGGRKIAIIDDADYFRHEAANCLLKTLEEPPQNAVIILLGTSDQKQLPTIRSRCQTIRFQPLAREHIIDLLKKSDFEIDETYIDQLADLSQGSLARAILLNDPAMAEFRELFLMQIANANPFDAVFVKDLNSFVDAAGKDAALRRERIRIISDWAINYYRELLNRISSGSHQDTDSVMQRAITVGQDEWNSVDTFDQGELISDCIERCIDLQSQVSANANQTTLLECWISDLGKIYRKEFENAY